MLSGEFLMKATGTVQQEEILFPLCFYSGTSMEAKLKELWQKLEKQCQINQELQNENRDLGKRGGLICIMYYIESVVNQLLLMKSIFVWCAGRNGN